MLLAVPCARAALPDEIQVYTDDINEPGDAGVELHVNTTPKGRRTPEFPNAANPVLDWALNGPERGGRPAFNPSLKVAKTVSEGTSLGFEHYTELGRLGRPAPRAERPQTLYLALETTRTPVPLHIGIGRGLNDAADKWTVKAILEFAFK